MSRNPDSLSWQRQRDNLPRGGTHGQLGCSPLNSSMDWILGFWFYDLLKCQGSLNMRTDPPKHNLPKPYQKTLNNLDYSTQVFKGEKTEKKLTNEGDLKVTTMPELLWAWVKPKGKRNRGSRNWVGDQESAHLNSKKRWLGHFLWKWHCSFIIKSNNSYLIEIHLRTFSDKRRNGISFKVTEVKG